MCCDDIYCYLITYAMIKAIYQNHLIPFIKRDDSI